MNAPKRFCGIVVTPLGMIALHVKIKLLWTVAHTSMVIDVAMVSVTPSYVTRVHRNAVNVIMQHVSNIAAIYKHAKHVIATIVRDASIITNAIYVIASCANTASTEATPT
jgi:hypothetical protein